MAGREALNFKTLVRFQNGVPKIGIEMNIKLSYYCLCTRWAPEKINPGTKVCSSNGTKSVGVVVGVGKNKKNHYDKMAPEEVTILWGTGKKRGKITTHNPENLVNFDKYFAAVKKEYDNLESKIKEVSTVGM